MKAASSNLATLLASTNEYQMADLYTFTLADGAVIRLTDAASNLVTGYVNTFSGTTVRIERSRVRSIIGVEVDQLTVTLYPAATDEVGNISFLSAIGGGAFDGARLKLERVFMPLYDPISGVRSWGNTTYGTIDMFEGRVAAITATRTSATLQINSDLELLDIQMPRNLYQPGCNRTLYDVGCAVNQAAYATPGTVLAGSSAQQFVTVLSQPAGWFDQGYITMISGAAAGTSMTVRSWAGGILTLVLPIVPLPSPGDTFTAWPGCDKTMATCQTKFNNLARFRGFPYIPPPETAL